MKRFDLAWQDLMDREGMILDMYCRYVDDCRLILPSLNKGWRWCSYRFVYTEQFEKQDIQEDLTDQQRTEREITKAMCSVVGFLKFTGEESSKFECGSLPTLDTRIWQENDKILYSFYEKPTVGNRVILKTTALPEMSVQSTLVQEVIRRLQNCSEQVSVSKRQKYYRILLRR